ncbi:MAG: hypothetical protein ACWGO1_10540 [Anaerolineales bacterium]
MMFEPNSRYYNLQTATYVAPDGAEIAYKRRRFLPDGETLPVLVEVRVTEGDRLDLITARSLGDPLGFWLVCDANNALNPAELTDKPGTVLRIPVPQA